MANPNLIVKSGEVSQSKRVLSVRERESLLHTARIYEGAMGAKDGDYPLGINGAGPVQAPGLNVNKRRLNEQQRQVLNTIKEHSPEPISERDRDAFVKRAEFCKERFLPVHQSRKEVHVTSRQDAAWFTATEKARKWLAPISKDDARTPNDYAEEYRNIMRRLEPENDQADSLDALRTDR